MAMGLRLKFNIVLVLVFAAGIGVSAWVSQRLLQDNAKEDVLHNAGLMMEAALSIRGYTVQQVKPHLEDKLQTVFLPQSVPAYSATEIFGSMRKKYPDFTYKEATLNPTNPRDRAVEWEADIVNAFRADPSKTQVTGQRMSSYGPQLYLARPIQIKDPACLACHTTAEIAPASMVKLYGPSNGFGWKLNEIIGAQIVSVPMQLATNNANEAFRAFLYSLVAIFAVSFVVLNAMLSFMIIRPISRMAEAADRISTGDFDVPEFTGKGKDEIAALGVSFNRMRRSLQKALKLIER
jgi:protein-histidine pros-kinase